MPKRVKLSDIAAKCGVSTVTVSKALSGQKGVGVELRSRIIAMADEMGYVKTTPKEHEGHHKTYTIGVVVAERYLRENQSFYWNLYQEISQATVARDSFAILEVISPELEKAPEYPKMVLEKKVEGLILLGQFQRPYLDLFWPEFRLPVLFLDGCEGEEGMDCVITNNLMGGKMMTDYLFSLGHRNIGFVGTRLSTHSIDIRYLGYYKSLMEHGIPLREDWIIDDRCRETGELDKDKFFTLPEEMPTAFFCNCDLTASLLIRKLEDLGYRVPEDISVVGFDNYVSKQSAGIGITTYEIDAKKMALKAVQTLLDRMKGKDEEMGIVVLPGRFLEKGSTLRVGEPVPLI